MGACCASTKGWPLPYKNGPILSRATLWITQARILPPQNFVSITSRQRRAFDVLVAIVHCRTSRRSPPETKQGMQHCLALLCALLCALHRHRQHYIPSHPITLHCITVTLHCITLHYTTLHSIILRPYTLCLVVPTVLPAHCFALFCGLLCALLCALFCALFYAMFCALSPQRQLS